MHIAARGGNVKIVAILIRNGADEWLRNNEGLTPREMAVQFNQPQVADILQAENVKLLQMIRKEHSTARNLFLYADTMKAKQAKDEEIAKSRENANAADAAPEPVDEPEEPAQGDQAENADAEIDGNAAGGAKEDDEKSVEPKQPGAAESDAEDKAREATFSEGPKSKANVGAADVVLVDAERKSGDLDIIGADGDADGPGDVIMNKGGLKELNDKDNTGTFHDLAALNTENLSNLANVAMEMAENVEDEVEDQEDDMDARQKKSRKEKMRDAMDDAVEAMEDAVENIEENIEDAVEDMREQLKHVAAETRQWVVTQSQSARNTLEAFLRLETERHGEPVLAGWLGKKSKSQSKKWSKRFVAVKVWRVM